MTIRMPGPLVFCAATVAVTLAAASVSIEHPYGAQAVAIDPGSRDYTLPDQMQWRDTENGKTANLFAMHQQVNFEISVFFAVDAYHARPARTAKLHANRFDLGRAELAVGFEFKSLDVNALESGQQLFDVSFLVTVR